jgi:hypothetical protein
MNNSFYTVQERALSLLELEVSRVRNPDPAWYSKCSWVLSVYVQVYLTQWTVPNIILA